MNSTPHQLDATAKEIIAKAKAAAGCGEKFLNTIVAGCLVTIHAFPKMSKLSGLRVDVLRKHGFGNN